LSKTIADVGLTHEPCHLRQNHVIIHSGYEFRDSRFPDRLYVTDRGCPTQSDDEENIMESPCSRFSFLSFLGKIISRLVNKQTSIRRLKLQVYSRIVTWFDLMIF
jgi:hypothetical protein